MRIAPRIISIFLPLFLVPMVIITFAATSTARDGITTIASNFLEFKSGELIRFSASEENLLTAHNLAGPEYVEAAKKSVANYAVGLTRNTSELIAAFNGNGDVEFSTSPLTLSPSEREKVVALGKKEAPGLSDVTLGGVRRVAVISSFKAFSWTIFVTDRTESFFRFIDRMTIESILIAGISLIAVVILVIVFARLLINPLNQVARAMAEIVRTGDLGKRVTIEYADEVGDLGNTFNAMTGALEHAYGEIKNYALQAAIAQKREMKIRNVFQKYVPRHVIDQFFAAPESMLVGQDRSLAILFSDIRGFTTMSENMSSHDIVESLNNYFGRMVDAIMRNNGLVDKYIGDAVMAFFGAPADDDLSCLHSVQSGFEMLDQLDEFNVWQASHGRAPVHIGIGINYGAVTIGNIGSEQKMDYTVIGDMVNLASRLEGLTRYYDEPLIISESIRRYVHETIPCRLIDRVQVKGRTRGLAIYAARRTLTEEEERAWKLHDRGTQYYYNRDFVDARNYFEEVQKILPQDPLAPIFMQRCSLYIDSPPTADWNGVVAFSEK